MRPSLATSSLTLEPDWMLFGSSKVRMAETEILAPTGTGWERVGSLSGQWIQADYQLSTKRESSVAILNYFPYLQQNPNSTSSILTFLAETRSSWKIIKSNFILSK